jgi:hypothetical protein
VIARERIPEACRQGSADGPYPARRGRQLITMCPYVASVARYCAESPLGAPGSKQNAQPLGEPSTDGGGGSRAQRPRRVLRRMPRRRWSARSSSPSRLAAHTKPTPTSTSGNASSTMTTTIATLFIRSVCLVSNTYGASRSFEDAGLSGKGRLRLRGGLCSDGGGRTPRWRLVGWNRGTGVVKMNPDGAQRYPTVCPPLP